MCVRESVYIDTVSEVQKGGVERSSVGLLVCVEECERHLTTPDHEHEAPEVLP